MPELPGLPHDAQLEVFLSHASSDREHVRLVQRQIEALGVRVYLAEHDPKPGTSIADKVNAALRRCDAVVVLITTTSINSNYVQQEIGAAHAYGKPIIPIVDASIDRSKLGMLSEVEHLRLDMSSPAEAMANVSASIQPLVLAQMPAVQPPTAAAAAAPGLLAGVDAGTVLLLMAVALVVVLLLAEGGAGSP